MYDLNGNQKILEVVLCFFFLFVKDSEFCPLPIKFALSLESGELRLGYLQIECQHWQILELDVGFTSLIICLE